MLGGTEGRVSWKATHLPAPGIPPPSPAEEPSCCQSSLCGAGSGPREYRGCLEIVILSVALGLDLNSLPPLLQFPPPPPCCLPSLLLFLLILPLIHPFTYLIHSPWPGLGHAEARRLELWVPMLDGRDPSASGISCCLQGTH